MGFFSFFSKDKKETLDKGLSKTKESGWNACLCCAIDYTDCLSDVLQETLWSCLLYTSIDGSTSLVVKIDILGCAKVTIARELLDV